MMSFCTRVTRAYADRLSEASWSVPNAQAYGFAIF
jgi:hypothetical protein